MSGRHLPLKEVKQFWGSRKGLTVFGQGTYKFKSILGRLPVIRGLWAMLPISLKRAVVYPFFSNSPIDLESAHLPGTQRFKFSSLRQPKLISRLFELADQNPTSLKVLDWGVGGGGLMTVMGGKFAEVWGVDISNTSLQCAATTAARHKIKFKPIWYELDGNIEEQLGGVPRDYFNLFISHNVFMHLPDEAMGEDIMKLAFKFLKPGGLATVNFNQQTPQSLLSEKGGVRSFYRSSLWQPADFKKMVKSCGFEILAFERHSLDHGKYKPGKDFYNHIYLQKPSRPRLRRKTK